MFIDTHTHLDDKAFKEDLEDVILRAKEAEVLNLITVSAAPGSIELTMELVSRFENVYGAVGLHPHDAKHFSPHIEAAIHLGSKVKKIVAIGEIGLDYHYNFSPPEIQREVFKTQLKIAKEDGLPVIIHDREATEDLLKILEEEKPHKGVIHCFTGDKAAAEKYLELGFHISFTGIITFPKAGALREVVKMVPMTRILLETDCPYLAPIPNRGKRNEPSFVKYTAESLAKIKGISLDEVAKKTTQNAKSLFGLK
ncbi:TatD family hydrolase [Bdellovibrionota bacterium]